MGVLSGDFDGGPEASDVFKRMVDRGQIKAEDFRILYRSQTFPTSSFAYAHDLEPKLRDTLLKCSYDYRFPAEMQKAFDGADRFFPINYKEHSAVVRQVAPGSRDKIHKTAFHAPARKGTETAPQGHKKREPRAVRPG